MIKIIQNAKENGMMVISIPAIPVFINHLPEGLRLLGKMASIWERST